jgi:sugar porter (SP) family MFS transporter
VVIRPFVILAAAIAALGGLLFGYDTGVISGAILFVKNDFGLNANPGLAGFVVSVVTIGCIVGAGTAGYFADRFGRRWSLLVAGVIFAVGGLLSAFAPSVAALVIARGIVGLAVGFASVASPLYVSEIAPAAIRGALVSLYQLAITVGILAAYIIDVIYARNGDWRMMLGVAVVPSAALVIGMLFMPESPRYLFKVGDTARAREELSRIHGDADAAIEEVTIVDSLKIKDIGFAAFKMPDVRFALFIGVGLATLQAITGINAVIYYGPAIFQMAHVANASSAIGATAIVGVVNVLLTFVAIFSSDRFGRKPLLYLSCSGMLIALVTLAVAFAVGGGGSSLGVIALISMMLYVGCFAFGLGPIVWVLVSEIFPLQARGLGMSISTLSNWVANFVVAQFFLIVVAKVGTAGTFSIFAVLVVVTIVFVARYVPETKRELLEKISVLKGPLAGTLPPLSKESSL